MAKLVLSAPAASVSTFHRSVSLLFTLSNTDGDMPSITSFSVSYDKLNNSGTFSEGDTISGKVSLELSKPIKIWSLSVRATGDANTQWMAEPSPSEENNYIYRGYKRLFKEKEFLVTNKVKETALRPGTHSFPFNIRIPAKYMPSSFRGKYGWIVYRLEAKLCRRIKEKKTVQQMFQFHSKSVPTFVQMCPVTASTVAMDIGSYVSGTVQMEARLEKNAFSPGETVTITTKVANSSHNIMKPMFTLRQIELYRAGGGSTTDSRVTKRQSGCIIRPQSEKEVTNHLVIPPGTLQTIHDCEIILMGYMLEVQLQVLYSDKEPRVDLPLVVIATDTRSVADFKPMESAGE